MALSTTLHLWDGGNPVLTQTYCSLLCYISLTFHSILLLLFFVFFFLTLEVLVHTMQNKTLFSVHFSLFNFINAWTASSKVRAQLVVIWRPFMPTLGFFSPPNPLHPVFLVPVSCSPESPVTLLSFLFSPVGHLWERTYSRGCFCERQTDGP